MKKFKKELSKHRIFPSEEWTRINEHLRRLENLRKAEQLPVADTENVKTPSLLLNRQRKTFEYRDTGDKEQWKTNEIQPKTESKRRALTCGKDKDEEIINRAKNILFENKDYARQLLYGLRLSSVLHERNRQIDFNQSLKTEMKNREREMNLKLREEAKKHEEELRNEKIRQMEKVRQMKNELDKQLSEKIARRERERQEKTRERKDLIKMNEELKAIREEERLEEEKKRRKLREDIENYTKSEMEIRRKLKMKEEEQEEINKIYQVVALEIEEKRRHKEKAPYKRAVKVDKEMFKEVKEPLRTYSGGDKKLKDFLLMREERRKALLNDYLSGKRMAEEELEKLKTNEKLERRRSAQRRFRKDEADKLRSIRETEERRRVMNNTMKCYIMQWMAKREEEQKEREMDKIYAPDFSEENQMIRKYCDEILGLVKRNKRPLYPIIAAVKEVKKEFELEPEKNPVFLKSNVPIGN